MARVLAIDYGRKRTGIAVTDQLQMIASGLKTIDTKNIFLFLDQYFLEEEVEAVVVGLSKTLKDELNTIEKEINTFLIKFKNKFDIPVHRIDERFTSKMAFQTMIDGGLSKKKRQNKALVDEISATIILQSFLEQKNRTKI